MDIAATEEARYVTKYACLPCSNMVHIAGFTCHQGSCKGVYVTATGSQTQPPTTGRTTVEAGYQGKRSTKGAICHIFGGIELITKKPVCL